MSIGQALIYGLMATAVCAIIYNVVGMGIMTSQIDDFMKGKRATLLGPPPLKVYARSCGMAWAIFTAAFYFL